MVWGSLLIAAAELKTPTRNDYKRRQPHYIPISIYTYICIYLYIYLLLADKATRDRDSVGVDL